MLRYCRRAAMPPMLIVSFRYAAAAMIFFSLRHAGDFRHAFHAMLAAAAFRCFRRLQRYLSMITATMAIYAAGLLLITIVMMSRHAALRRDAVALLMSLFMLATPAARYYVFSLYYEPLFASHAPLLPLLMPTRFISPCASSSLFSLYVIMLFR